MEGCLQGVDDERFVCRVHRQTPEQLLVLDELRPRTNQALNDQIESIVFFVDAVLVHGSTDELVTAWIARLQPNLQRVMLQEVCDDARIDGIEIDDCMLAR